MTDATNLDTAQAIADAVRSGRRSAVEVTRTHLARIDQLDDALGAFRSVRHAAALAEAATIDARSDRSVLPLAGVPIAVKDNIAVAGEQVRHGSEATSSDAAVTDDELVVRLRRAGAVVVGVTRMSELAAWAFTSSTAFGVTRNPWNPDFDPGGSTGGGAVAVATGMAALALGTDGGGSLRVPAAYCGVVGVKPGRGEVPLPDGLPEHWCGLSVAGLIARTAADAALGLAVLSDQRPTALHVASTPLRIAVSRRSPVPTSRADAHQRAALDQAVTRLRALGHEVVDADPPYPPTLMQQWSRRWWAGIALDAERLATQPDRLEKRTRTMVAKGRRVLRFGGPRPASAARWRESASRWLSRYDVLVTPTVATVPPRAGAFNGKGYLPTFFGAARSVPFCQAWNLAGFPAVSVPVGMRDGLPLAVQLIGGPGSEPALLGAATILEEVHAPGL
jgi:amidase